MRKKPSLAMTLNHCIIAAGFLLFLAGCSNTKSENPKAEQMVSNPIAQLPEITSESEEGFVDLVFHIEQLKSHFDGSQGIRIAGLHKGREVRFVIILGPGWRKGRLGKDVQIETHQGMVSYVRSGSESDTFLQVLDELYGSKLKPNAMAEETPFTAMSLEGNPGELSGGAVKMKLFYENGGEAGYAELYTNIDQAAHKVEIREKDEGYRKQIVEALEGKSAAKP